MFNQTFFHGVMRKYVVLIGTLFNDIYINRQDSSGEIVQSLKVPLVYGPKEKYLTRSEGDSELDRPIATVLPVMSFEMTNMSYDPSRKTSKLARICAPDGSSFQYAPVPYNFNFTVSLMTNSAEDATIIIEQILPFFTPDWTAKVNLVSNPPIQYDIPVVLDSIQNEADSYRGPNEIRRVIIWNLTLTLKGWLFGPTRKTSGVIKHIEVNLFDSISANAAFGSVSIVPGLTANGEPTSYSNNSIPLDEISANSNYGFITTFTERL